MTALDQKQMMEEAGHFIHICYGELGKSEAETHERWLEVRQAIEEQGYYEHTLEELQHGAKMAWRNSNRCIGRLFWETLEVFDARSLQTEEDIAEALYRHIDYATNEGRIRPAITVFRSSSHSREPVRIRNYQLIRYAGYKAEEGVIGDPDSLEMTRFCSELGWSGKGSPFDVLPIVVQIGDRLPRWFDIPQEKVLEVPISHPDFPAFSDLQLKWYAVPIVSNMRLEIGGISYPAAPFNGWYMGTEIGARNFADIERYNMLPRVASLLELDTQRESSLWRDRALVELNMAVLHSYKQHGVSIVDHHTAAQQFMKFEEKEQRSGREVTGNWTWLIPPLSPAATPIFHKPYNNKIEKPNFFYPKKQ